MSTRAETLVDVEDLETTKSEKLLAVVLAVFMLIGGIWTYQKLDDYVAEALASSQAAPLTAAERAAVERYEQAVAAEQRARENVAAARAELDLARETYRTALDEGRPAPQLEQGYERAQAQFVAAGAVAEEAERAVRAAQPAADAAYRRQAETSDARFDRHELAAFLVRLGFVLAVLGASYWALGRLRVRRSRYLPAAFAAVATAAILALVLAGDYLTDYVDPLDVGPLVLSLAGIALTLAAFVALQRYLARRIPIRRVRKGECPFCGYTARPGQHCEGCGRRIVAECTACHRPRRVGTAHCAACGQTGA
jgi:uncharacterized membrane protein YidH (DUF202 family)